MDTPVGSDSGSDCHVRKKQEAVPRQEEEEAEEGSSEARTGGDPTATWIYSPPTPRSLCPAVWRQQAAGSSREGGSKLKYGGMCLRLVDAHSPRPEGAACSPQFLSPAPWRKKCGPDPTPDSPRFLGRSGQT
ncbi:unnamed protein product [Pleuronectes platessa]|uniref:Uncharacterized protein n=1 Tax=Pleuronectes platessa TaxID=8262 RepID=A0A9N7UFY5_PLEPL|nr:unnamed protein product [Pleuronectes platessa]